MVFEATARAEREFAKAGENLRSLIIAKLEQFAAEPEEVRWRHWRHDVAIADYYGERDNFKIGRLKANRRFRIACERLPHGLRLLGFFNRSNQKVYWGEAV